MESDYYNVNLAANEATSSANVSQSQSQSEAL